MYTVNENPKGLTQYSNYGSGLVLEKLTLDSREGLNPTICFYDYAAQKDDIFGGISDVEESGFTKSMEAMFDCLL